MTVLRVETGLLSPLHLLAQEGKRKAGCPHASPSSSTAANAHGSLRSPLIKTKTCRKPTRREEIQPREAARAGEPKVWAVEAMHVAGSGFIKVVLKSK